ncbi:hypothetical protein [Streptacidiphilus cavernicola]|uniref:Uncharacterized protein n=1 Tax=Streptacidiphilus cavernicola TaxID=3342716 RepID=A0ABV6VQ28_9ACTN
MKVTLVQMPAVNTPPVRPGVVPPAEPRPAGPPDLPARGRRPRRDVRCRPPGAARVLGGGSTAVALLANAVAPGILDRYLARTGYVSQQDHGPAGPDAPQNLWHPVDADTDEGAHGRFDDRSSSRSYQLWASQHHGVVAATALAAVGGAIVAAGRAARR